MSNFLFTLQLADFKILNSIKNGYLVCNACFIVGCLQCLSFKLEKSIFHEKTKPLIFQILQITQTNQKKHFFSSIYLKIIKDTYSNIFIKKQNKDYLQNFHGMKSLLNFSEHVLSRVIFFWTDKFKCPPFLSMHINSNAVFQLNPVDLALPSNIILKTVL